MPGGPISVRIAPERLSSAMPRSCAELAHGQVLDDPVLHVLEPGVVGVEHLARVDRVEPLLGALAPRHGEQPVEVGADHRGLAALLAHPLEPGELALGLLAHGVRHAGLGDLRAVVVGDGGVVLAELLADRLELLRRMYSRCCLLRALLDVVADAPAHLQLGEPLALEAEGELEPLDDVDRLEQLDLLLEGELGRVGGRVGERAGLADRADERPRCGRRRRAARGSPRRPRGTRARARASARPAAPRRGARRPRRAGGPAGRCAPRRRSRGAGPSSVTARPPPGRRTRSADLGDGADLGVLAVVARHEEHALLVADVRGDGDVHVREDDDVVQRNEQQRAHQRFLALLG